MFSFIPTSRQERRSLYLQQYQPHMQAVHVTHEGFAELYPRLYRQILVDCRRSLFGCFQAEDMKQYLRSLESADFLEGVDIDALEYTPQFSRKS